MTCITEFVIIRHVEIMPSGKLGADIVTVGLLKYGLNGTRCNHWRMVRQSEPMNEREAQKMIKSSDKEDIRWSLYMRG